MRGELARLKAGDVKGFHLVNAVSATISQAEVDRLSANPDVQAVVPDALRTFGLTDTAGAPGGGPTSAPTAGELQQICPPNPAVPLLEPEALQVMNVEFQPGSTLPAAHDLVDGTGVRVGIIADGFDPNNPDLVRNGHSIVFDYQDFSGFGNDAPTDGRESFLDAGAIASQGNQVYDLSGFVNPAHPLPPGCNIRIKGVAPGVTLAVMNLAGPNPGFYNSTILQAIERVVEVDNVDVLNESIGANPIPDTHDDPVQLANAAAVAAGVVVVGSTGDAGPTNTIGSPETNSGIIAAAGTTTLRVYRQTTRYGTQLSPGGWESNNITALSSGGTSEFGAHEPDVAAPGDRGWSLCSNDIQHYFGCLDLDHGTNPPPIWAGGGTSLSCPLVSGTAALVIQAYARAHNAKKPSPELVKRIIVSTADDLGAPSDHQGAGLVNTLKAVQLAQSIHDDNGNPAPTGAGLLVNKPNLSAIVPAGARPALSIRVTNSGATPQRLSPTLVGLSANPVSSDTGSVTLSAASPTFIDGEGNSDSFALHQFSVPQGVDYLNGDIDWNAATRPTAAFETVFDPAGRVVAYSLLGSDHSGHGHVEIHQPVAGTWTAAIFTVNNAFHYDGAVQFAFTTQRFVSSGSVSPSSRMLNPGQSATFDVQVDRVNQPGDHVSTLRLNTGSSTDAGLPVVVRTLVQLNGQGGSFDGTLTGGADSGNAGQRLSYQFDIPEDKPSLNVAVRLRDPDYHILGFLTDPAGMPLDVQSTAVFESGGGFAGFGPTLQLFHVAPRGGRWTLSLLVASPIDGARLSEPFTTRIDFRKPPVVARGLPSSPGTVLAAGVPVTATIRVTNTGNVNKDFFADARLNAKAFVGLVGSGTADVPLPLSFTAQPNWLVPPGTDQLLVEAQASAPIVLEVSAANGDPDVLGSNPGGVVSLAKIASAELFPGFFFGLPELFGPVPRGGASGTVNLAAIARTNAFDSAVKADTGDFWQLSVDPDALDSYAPLTLAPGESGTITVVITPSAPRGSVVRGFVAIDTFNFDSFSGDEVAILPYVYRVD